MFERLCKFLSNLPPATGPLLPPRPGPLTEGKTRGYIKGYQPSPPTRRPKGGPPIPAPSPRFKSGVPPKHTIKCDWIEIYLSNANNPPTIEQHEKVVFWKDEHGDLFIKDASKNLTVYHQHIKYVYRI